MNFDQARTVREGLMSLHRRLRAEHLGEVSLTLILVLGVIDRRGARTHPSDIAGELGIARSNVAVALRELTEAGLVVAGDDPEDGRRKLLRLTPRGKALLKRDRERREAWLVSAAGDELSPDERETLVRAADIMRRLADWKGTDR
ncbi:MarR family winged helix-turn-helix transcriptional regulator [Flexivirga meconopsidis]|uniref:MarR family winged helix-turn-helix transcriptional regulator n=1 Tax=Flexivirga meconopsidis TaxID=2977121 RepID=UPI0022401BEC|nr:winged helix DNA-binding protein [Flexivirga meconopsidis]